MVNLGRKIVKKDGQEPTELEADVAQALIDLEQNNAYLKNLYIVGARQIDVDARSGKSAIVIFVPFVLHKEFKEHQNRLTRDLEKKFSGDQVVFIAQRTIFGISYKRQNRGALRPRSRTLTEDCRK